jgi:septation ring formation regulator EzrA
LDFILDTIISILIGGLSEIGGMFLSIIWSIILLYVLPVLLILFGIYKRHIIKSYISKLYSKRNKVSNKIVKNTINDIKCEELAKQAYESLKKDFPNIKFEDILGNIKSKI